MKNFFLIFFFCIGSWATAQQESNPFSSAEQNNTSNQNEGPTYETANGNVTNPPGENDPEPVPVDDYLPLLVMTAVGIIIYKTQKKRSLGS